ncbi:MAG TPA: hypothetical protein VH302_05750 [Bryobacteraceae bacterium]|nr:hypothetical protein [Bryobacteraceae bacterium]
MKLRCILAQLAALAWAGTAAFAGNVLQQSECKHADRHELEKQNAAVSLNTNSLYLRVHVASGAICNFSYSLDGAKFLDIGEKLTATPGRWVGAKVGLFSISPQLGTEMGNADFDWFHVNNYSR